MNAFVVVFPALPVTATTRALDARRETPAKARYADRVSATTSAGTPSGTAEASSTTRVLAPSSSARAT